MAGNRRYLYRGFVRIAQVCPYSLTLPGGVQGQVMGLARALRALGHDTRVLAPCDGPPPDAGVTPLGKSIPLAENGSVAPIAPDISCALRTIRVLRDEPFDIVHIHEPLVPGPSLTALTFSDAVKVGTFHRAGDYNSKRMRFGARRFAKWLDIRCAVSEDARATARAALGGEYELVFNGIEIERFFKATPWPTDGPTIFFIGRHEPRKGLAVLLDAMGHLPPDVRLWIGGNGPQTEELKTKALGDPRITWLGRISDDERARRLRAADIFCAPSLHGESFGVVLLEAMAAQTPIVASDLDGYRNVARPGRDAVLVEPGDPHALGRALCSVLDNPGLAADLVGSGDLRAAEFSMDRLAERYVEFYEEAIRNRREQG